MDGAFGYGQRINSHLTEERVRGGVAGGARKQPKEEDIMEYRGDFFKGFFEAEETEGDMSNIKRDTEFLAEKIRDELAGATISGPVLSADGESFGFEAVRPDGSRVLCWIDRDAEGNGPGWINVTSESRKTAVPLRLRPDHLEFNDKDGG
jgi:hypothetical protein